MANVDENTPGAGGVATTERPERSERTDKGTLKARPREDDDQIDPAEYARLLDSYDNSFRNIAEGEVVKGTVLKVTASEVIVDVGYKSEGIISVDEFLDENRRNHGPGRRHRRRAARAHRRPRRLRRPLARKSREDEDLGRGREGLRRTQGRHRPRDRAHQGRPRGGHRRPRVPARLADRRPSRPQPRRAARPGAADARDQGQQEARQHRAVAQGAPRGGERREEEAHARHPRRGQGPQGRRQEHHRLRRVHRSGRHRRPAAHHRHVVGPRRASVRAVQGQRRDRRDRAEVRPGDRARLARPQAADHRSVGERDGALPGRRADGRQGGQPDRLRRVHRARGGRRRADPRQRDVVEQARQAPVEAPQRRRHRRRDGARRRSDGARASRSASSRSRPTRGTTSPTSIRSARRSRARSATSPSSARSSKSKRRSTA